MNHKLSQRDITFWSGLVLGPSVQGPCVNLAPSRHLWRSVTVPKKAYIFVRHGILPDLLAYAIQNLNHIATFVIKGFKIWTSNRNATVHMLNHVKPLQFYLLLLIPGVAVLFVPMVCFGNSSKCAPIIIIFHLHKSSKV